MLFSEWYNTNWNIIVIPTVRVKLQSLYNIRTIQDIIIDDLTNWIHELDNLTLLYSSEYVNNFILNEVYEFTQKNYLLYQKLASFNEDGGFSDQDKEDIKNSYSVGGFDVNNQDLTSGALRNDHSTSSKNKVSNLDVLNKLKDIKLLEREKFLNKIKECLVIIW